ncbi:TPA: hypothetical protein N0F65_000226 [Lagenidium giganteum]|uniref:tRNA (guanine-N(7)-)-methyltransferase n=1 Tax=Lagenidium giganteum TaxID=4803 RepID=A0AAV2YG88_9STRA|nr:TPA: hypothetical protein N0F65_000226 [Lagenidium giganteum]
MADDEQVQAPSDAPEASTQVIKAPQKKFFRSRAHCNPLSHNDSFEYPTTPEQMDWSPFYPSIKEPKVEFLDVGCGFGGLTVALGKLFPNNLTLALEIRPKVTEYVRLRIEALRAEHPGQYGNVAAARTNAMRYLPHFFKKGQLTKMFFCFPDPQFKLRNHRRRIVNTSLLSEYAYLLAPGGILYTITDVEDLHNWHVEKCTAHPCFTRIPDEELASDPCVEAMTEETEEGKKVARGGGKKYVAVFRRKADEDVAEDRLFW